VREADKKKSVLSDMQNNNSTVNTILEQFRSKVQTTWGEYSRIEADEEEQERMKKY